MFEKMTVEIRADKPVSDAWRVFTDPSFIVKWNFASADWRCPRAENDPVTGGSFNYRMESADGKFGFNFEGKYTKIGFEREIEYVMPDDRTVRVEFIRSGAGVIVRETFDAETENSVELQRSGWQAILDNYKSVLESE